MTVNISCMMVTKPGREHLARRAIDDFYRQTHADRDLVVVATDPRGRDELSAYVEDRATPRAMVVLEQEAPLGALRNAALDCAAGPAVCQWDDDDRHHPERLAVQLGAMAAAGRHSCCLTGQLYYYPDETPPSLYVVDWTLAPTAGSGVLIPGTLLCVKSWVQYGGTLRRGEDTRFLRDEFEAFGPAAAVDRPGLYARGFHYTRAAGNTTSLDRAAKNVQARGWGRGKLEARRAELEADIGRLGLTHATVRLMAADGMFHILLAGAGPR